MKKPALKVITRRLEAAAAAYPGAYAAQPWGETVYKVRGKVFIFLGQPAKELSFSLKLPHSGDAALVLPFTEPTHYGLGKAGWVTASFAQGDDVPEGLLLEWLDESYRAVAPKKLVKQLDEAATKAPTPLTVPKVVRQRRRPTK
jgi:predicted DNA-binding protein (MmcQ/YjbR family)